MTCFIFAFGSCEKRKHLESSMSSCLIAQTHINDCPLESRNQPTHILPLLLVPYDRKDANIKNQLKKLARIREME